MYPAILFVDDDESLLEFLKQLTSGWAYDIFLANSGDEALQLIEEYPIKSVLADQEMPEMRGTELLDKVKTRYPNIVRCIMTGYSDQQSAIDAINKGEVFRFLRKPFTIEQLQGVLEDATEEFEKNRGREELFQKMEKLSQETSRKDRERQIHDTIAVLQMEDPGIRVLQINEAASKIFQISNADLPYNLAEFFAAEDANELWSDLRHQVQVEGIARAQKRFSSVPFPGIYELILVPITESAAGDRMLFKLIVQSRHQVDSSEMSLYKYVLDLENAAALKDRGLKFLYDMSKKIGMTHDLEELVQNIFADLKQIIS
ncbi:MAG: response regulator, partial [Candidatus Marinimicrobia bacterium]|nr:response regulator [Candidatus Neomarinimicrobiota bacterium]